MNDDHEASNAARDLIFPRPKESNGWTNEPASDESDTIRPRAVPRSGGGHSSNGSAGKDSPSVAAEVMPLVEPLIRRWYVPLGCGLLLAALGVSAALYLWKKEYTAVAQLVYYDSPTTADVFGPRQIAPQTFVGMFRSPELLRKVAAQANPPVSPEALARDLKVVPEHNSDIFAVAVSGPTAEATVDLINLYAQEAVRSTQKMQSDSAREVSRYLEQQVTQLNQELAPAREQLIPAVAAPAGAASSTSLSPPSSRSTAAATRTAFLTTRLEAAREELFELLTRYTDAHPQVVAQKAKIDAIDQQIRAQIAAGPGAAAPSEIPPAGAAALAANPAPLRTASSAGGDPEVMRSKLQSLENTRVNLMGRQRAAQSYAENPPGYFRVLAPAALKDVVVHDHLMKIIALGIFCGVVGIAGASGLLLSREVMDDHLKTAADVKRVTKLPMLASLHDMKKMSPRERRDWAFRTWTSLQNRMSHSPNHGLVCGVTSSGEGEGRSTWINLLAQEASQLGFRVLTIATQPSTQTGPDGERAVPPAPQPNGQEPGPDPQAQQGALVAANALAAPAEVTEKLTGPNSQPVVHIPLPGWVWNLERRKQWQGALNHWRGIDNIVILVELPPSDTPEAVLLAQNLPNVVWLSDSGKATAAETRGQLETLRHARCNLVGSVLNHAPKLALENRFPRWIASAS